MPAAAAFAVDRLEEPLSMIIRRSLALTTLLGLAACGGSDPPAAAGIPQNAFTGTVTVTGTMPAGTTTCLTTTPVVFTSTAVDLHAVAITAGGCVAFVNGDTAVHQVANNAQSSCNELTGGGPIAAGNTLSAGPFTGPKTCNWLDTTRPPVAAGGGGGGGY
jgi:hypothetical protein